MMLPGFYPSQNRGSALLLVLWAILLLSTVVLSTARLVQSDLEETTLWMKQFKARQLAESGLAFGMHPEIKKDDPLLKSELAPGERFEVRITNEGSRLNINALVNEKDGRVLKGMFERWGMEPEKIDRLWDTLRDWADADSNTRINGAESREYELAGIYGLPKNRSFQSLDEVAQVIGWDEVELYRPDWRDLFTVWGDGKVDVNEASEEVIRAVCSVSLEQARTLVSRRWGPDEKVDTEDDVRYTDLEEVRKTLGIGKDQFQKIEGMLTVAGSDRRIESVGIIGIFRYQVTVVVKNKGNPPQWVDWQEH